MVSKQVKIVLLHLKSETISVFEIICLISLISLN